MIVKLKCEDMTHTCLTFPYPPPDFNPTLEVAACYCECQDHLLILKRHHQKSQGGTWGVPAGKLEAGETAEQALIRELLEELELSLKGKQLRYLGKLYIRHPRFDFIYHLFYTCFNDYPLLVLNLKEHTEYLWLSYHDVLAMPLMEGERETLSYYKQWKETNKSIDSS